MLPTKERPKNNTKDKRRGHELHVLLSSLSILKPQKNQKKVKKRGHKLCAMTSPYYHCLQ